MSNEAEDLKNGCLAILFFVIGVVIVGYALYLSGQAAESDFAPSRAILQNSAAAMYMFGIPLLLMGVCLALRVYRPSNRIGSPIVPIYDDKRIIQATDSLDVACPDCGFILGPELGMREHDGSVACGRCNKRFVP